LAGEDGGAAVGRRPSFSGDEKMKRGNRELRERGSSVLREKRVRKK
jgi:hypothetical protein